MDFWLALPKAKINKLNLMCLPDDCTLFGTGIGGSKLFVRKCYEELVDIIFKHVNGKNKNDLL